MEATKRYFREVERLIKLKTGSVSIIDKIFGSRKKPSEILKNGLLKHFPLARSIEWNGLGNCFEAIFYDGDAEKIARFNSDGVLLEQRVNIAEGGIPEVIIASLGTDYELMNCIELQQPGSLQYEIIARDKNLIRYLLIFDTKGLLVSKSKL